MLVVINFDWRIYAAADGYGFNLPVRAGDAQRQVLLRPEPRAEADDVIRLGSVQFQR